MVYLITVLEQLYVDTWRNESKHNPTHENDNSQCIKHFNAKVWQVGYGQEQDALHTPELGPMREIIHNMDFPLTENFSTIDNIKTRE